VRKPRRRISPLRSGIVRRKDRYRKAQVFTPWRLPPDSSVSVQEASALILAIGNDRREENPQESVRLCAPCLWSRNEGVPMKRSSSALAYWTSVTAFYALHACVLMVCGYDWDWWQGWAYSFLFGSAGVGLRLWAERRHPGLMAERAQLSRAPGIKPWDRLLAPLMALTLGLPLFVVAGLDHRFQLSPHFPTWLNILGLVLAALGYGFAGWAMVENRFFSAVVRIQSERGHAVCDTGPYEIVRHPGYSGSVLATLAMALALDSVWTLIPATAAVVIAVVRTALEDRTLQKELPGYREYADRVRYRLIPGIY
jgi:protein-S-isoprenylcysteine O-methyltransferase Ste14